MARNFRDVFRHIVPSWLNDGSDGSRVLFTLSLLVDASAERFLQALLSRFPSYASASALRLLGRERGIPWTRGESAEAYATRLNAWRHPRGHRVRGSDFGLLEQIRALFRRTVGVAAIDANGTQCTIDANGNTSCTLNGSWSWDSRPASEWSRFWLRIDGLAANYEVSDSRFGTDVDAVPQTIGVRGLTADDIRTIRYQILSGEHPWRPAGTQPEWLIISPTGYAVEPNASWERWTRYFEDSGYRWATPARSPDFGYVPLRAEHETYAGDPAQFYTAFKGLTQIEIISGRTVFFPTVVGLVSPYNYAPGDPTSFPTSLTLLHDGIDFQ